MPEIVTGVRYHFAVLSKKNKFRGVNMLDAIQISLALWAMIVCGGIKGAQLVQLLF